MPFYLNWIYKKGHRFWAILQMKSCLSIKNGEHIEKLETYYFFHISKPPQDSVNGNIKKEKGVVRLVVTVMVIQGMEFQFFTAKIS